jgi:uncharacterized damage-inducible protein DinB
MFTSPILQDIHHRAHQSLTKLLVHCRGLSDEELHRPVIEGLSEPSVQLLMHHIISAERYWVGVLQGRMDVDEDQADYPTADRLEAFRQRIFASTEEYLRGASSEEFSTSRPMITWGNKERILIPAHVIIRTQMHIYHHFGQVAVMCRIMGKPIPPGMDYPIA